MSSETAAGRRARKRAADTDAIAARCRDLVRRRAAVSAVAAAVPIPGLGLAVDLGVLMQLLEEINEAFGLTPQRIEALPKEHRAATYRAIAMLGSTAVGRVITRELIVAALRRAASRWVAKSFLRYVPFAGQALAAGLSYAAIRFIGERHIDDCIAVVRAERARTS
jgi:uncharacterized protein (DUF697 family)